MVPASLRVRSVYSTFGGPRHLDGLNLEVRTGGSAASSPERRGESPPPSRILLACVADARLVHPSWAATRGTNVETLHRRLAYVPGDVTLWPNLCSSKVINLLGRLPRADQCSRRNDLINKFKVRSPTEEDTYSKGNQAEGHPRRRPSLRH